MNLFHYCSNRSFLSIIQNRQMVLSEVTLSNDTLEGKWAKQVFSALCAEDEVLAEHQEKLVRHFDFLSGAAGGMAFCLSEDGDLLSQWRGYADNGAGVSIGFDKKYLEGIHAANKTGALLKVVYEPADQSEGLRGFVSDLKKQIGLGAFKSAVGGLLQPRTKEQIKEIIDASTALWMCYANAVPTLYTYKNPAFREEREWRILSYLLSSELTMDAETFKKVEFRAAHDRIIPMRRIPLTDEAVVINKVILGPRNITPANLIVAALSKSGFRNVTVEKSEASYR